MSDLPVAEGGGGTDPPFRRIAVIGFGLIGASLALAVRECLDSVPRLHA